MTSEYPAPISLPDLDKIDPTRAEDSEIDAALETIEAGTLETRESAEDKKERIRKQAEEYAAIQAEVAKHKSDASLSEAMVHKIRKGISLHEATPKTTKLAVTGKELGHLRELERIAAITDPKQREAELALLNRLVKSADLTQEISPDELTEVPAPAEFAKQGTVLETDLRKDHALRRKLAAERTAQRKRIPPTQPTA